MYRHKQHVTCAVCAGFEGGGAEGHARAEGTVSHGRLGSSETGLRRMGREGAEAKRHWRWTPAGGDCVWRGQLVDAEAGGSTPARIMGVCH